jgi:hypothetical protein
VQASSSQCTVEDVFCIFEHRSTSENDAAWAARPADFDTVSWSEARTAALASRRASLKPTSADDATEDVSELSAPAVPEDEPKAVVPTGDISE